MHSTVSSNWILAQSAPPLSGAPAPSSDTSAGTVTSGTAAPAGAGGGGVAPAQSPFPMLLLFGVMGALILFTVFGNRRETKRKQAMLEALKKNDRVQTSGGIIGSIVELKPDVVVLKVDENSNTRVTFARAAIIGVVKEAISEGSSQPQR